MSSEDDTKQHGAEMDRRQWHVGKEIPLALVAALLVQTVGLVWSIAGLYNRVDNLVQTTSEMKLERYTKEDARRDRDMVNMVIEAQRQRDNEQERRISIMESLQNQWRTRP
jgi:hypothetical protein